MSRSINPKVNSQLSFERLEPRQLLAADMAEIFGAVTVDIQGDGNPNNDRSVSGATASLYVDNGNGTHDAGDALVGSDVTDLNGRYKFEGLGTGKYFVKVTLPANLDFKAGQNVREVNITANEANGVVGRTIDGFTSFQFVQATPPLPSSDLDSLIDINVLGGERDMYVKLDSAENPVSSVSLASNNGKLYFASGSGVTGTAKIVWDGVDSNGQLVNPTGLGGVDLTEANGNRMTGIALTSGADHPNAVIKLRIYSDANNWSEFTTTVPETIGGTADGQATFNFSDTPTASPGNGANFANVGAIELTFEGVSAVDAQVTEVELVGIATKEANFTALPMLSLGDQVWSDKDDDGIFDADEAGIPNVKVNLYQDTNGDNSYTQDVDQLMDSTTTDASGNYLFGGLFPGAYVVQIDPMNFQVNQPLSGLVTSLQGTTAPDPDNNVNNDDNGTSLAGAGVVSSAVSLSGRAEPTNDGDSDNNSNLSVDFGFFGFDLALDKAIQQTTVSPQETLEYKIKIDNRGPSAAENTTFTDSLPSHVTYVDGTVSTGAALSHASGVVTADLGTMQPGDVIYITIFATVNDDATGTLINTATVAAPKEVDLSNNTDRVTNVLEPKIDLAITKSDSEDPVDPGAEFTYTIEYRNNGPSDATEVVIVDELPDDGVTFVGASVTPDNISGDDLTFNIGDLAAGESGTLSITVRVDEDFSGELLNVTEISGREIETTLTNNRDTEPTVVVPKIDLAITKTDSDDPVASGSEFFYTIQYVNNGPSDATEVVIIDELPADGVTFVSASITPSSISGDDLTFNIGDLDAGDSGVITITVRVDDDFSGELLNVVEISGAETETTLANNRDIEPTLVELQPGSISGTVYVDQNTNGTFDSGEKTISGVTVKLIGSDIYGNTVEETTQTDANGRYWFVDLNPGTYRIEETQPERYLDGEETVGTLGGATGKEPGLLIIPNDVDATQIDDLLFGINLQSGEDGTDYNFGEQAVSISKLNFIRSMNW